MAKTESGAAASKQENAKLEHTEKGAVTTRDDALDSGVPMLQGDSSEPSGPEDALGAGPKRGDYSEVIGNKAHYASVPNPNRVPGDPASPASVLVYQNPLVEDRGDEKGKKGGTHPLSEVVSK